MTAVPLTVLMPARAAAATLAATLLSLRAQTLPAFALLLVNDGSDVSLRDIAHHAWHHAGPQRPLRILDLPPVGLVAALQAGLQQCTTPWVARMDADDLAHPERLAKQWDAVQAQPVQVLACGVESFSEAPLGEGFRLYDAWQNQLLRHEDILRERFIESPLVHPSVLYHRETVLRAGGYCDTPWAEDYDLWLRLAASGARFAKLPDILLQWRDHPRRATRADTRYRHDALLRCKAHYLAQGPLRCGSAVVWGAGAVGRRLGRYLQAAGCSLRAFIDVDARKVGGVRRGHVPVLGVADLPSLRATPLVSAVGNRGARQLIRAAVHAAGWVEGEDFWCAA